ncbi:uncharacterized protein LOC123668235 isoform X2 [Melitaea cinxia]|uniref:uncharacterized protein LOC123668235 isoform X2 n=1 Tax=Melitaea cinxia TaxID=113334 RepID=UPI001E273CC6|nr:uncharacterized protein LOC123668235 isoform X2 [Melitaea cinxia]
MKRSSNRIQRIMEAVDSNYTYREQIKEPDVNARYDEQFQELDFLAKKFDIQSIAPVVKEPRGVKSVKKNDIINKLVPMMPESRRAFWHHLPTNDKSVDLSFMGQMEQNE